MPPTVPSIDFKPFLCGSASDRLRIASEIDEALSSVGFIQLHNHGIEQHKVHECFQWCVEWLVDVAPLVAAIYAD